MRPTTSTALALIFLLSPAVLAAQHPRIELGAEIRGLQQWEPPVAGGSGESPALIRSRLAAEAVPVRWGRLILELQHARGFGEALAGGDSVGESYTLHQAYIELAGGAEVRGRLRLGRQEIALGNERLIGRHDWSAGGRSFDAARLLLEPARGWWDASVFVGRVAQPLVPRDPVFRPDPEEHLLVAGWFLTDVADAFAIHEDDGVGELGRGFDRTTVGVRLGLPDWLRLRAEVEWAYQLGELTARSDFGEPRGVHHRSVRASLLALRLGLPEPVGNMEYLGIGIDRLSGQEQDSRAYTAFHPLYGSPHRFYGQRDLFYARTQSAGEAGDAGLVDAFIEARWPVEGAGTLEVAAHRFLAAEDRRFVEDRELGWELDLRMPIDMAALGELDLGYSLFDVGYGGLKHWAYAQLTIGL